MSEIVLDDLGLLDKHMLTAIVRDTKIGAEEAEKINNKNCKKRMHSYVRMHLQGDNDD